MREFEYTFDQGLIRGLRAFKGNPLNFPSLVEARSVVCDESGLVPYNPLVNKFTDIPLDWPFPQIYIGKRHNLLFTRHAVYTFDSSFNKTKIFDFEILHLGNPTWTLGQWEVYDSYDYILATDGNVYIKRDPVLNVWLLVTLGTNIPKFQTICNFKGQMVAGNLTGWHDADENFVAWSKINSADFTPDQSNTAGYIPMDWEGPVWRCKKLGNQVVVYGKNGVTLLSPVSTPIVGFGKRELGNIGLLNKYAVAGDEHIQVYISEDQELWKIGKDFLPKKIGYKEWIQTLDSTKLVCSYNSKLKWFYISDDTTCYVLSQFGLTKAPQVVGSSYMVDKELIGTGSSVTDSSATVVTDTIDYAQRSLKTLEFLEYGHEGGGTLEGFIDWRIQSGSFTRSTLKRVNKQGVVNVRQAGAEVRLGIKASSYTDFYLDYIKARVKLTDKRSVRGLRDVKKN